MKEYNAVDLILKLTGDINPIGDSAYDRKVLNNIKDFAEIVEELISELIEVAIFYNDSSFASVQEVDKYVYKKLKEFKDSINEALEDDGWIPVSERLPEENGVYIVSYEDSVRLLEWFNGKWFFYPSNPAREETGTITAWMPLPESYKAESEG